jgi:sugar lactone lactonase YvrE
MRRWILTFAMAAAVGCGPSEAGVADLSMPADLAVPSADGALSDLPPPCQTVVVSTLTGNHTFGFFDGTGGANGTTEFRNPLGVAVDSVGNVYVADFMNHRVRRVAPDGTTTTLAGNGTPASTDGTGGADGGAQFQFPTGVTVGAAVNVYVAESGAARIREIVTDGGVHTATLAGNKAGFFDGPDGATSLFYGPAAVAFRQGVVYVADGHRIRKVAAVNGATTTLAGNGVAGFFDGTGGANGTTQFNSPQGVAVDNIGNVYVADATNNRIRKVALDGTTTTLAGTGTSGSLDGPGATAQFNNPQGVAVDLSTGDVYVADNGNNCIRKVAPDGTTTTLAGSSSPLALHFQDGVGCQALFGQPNGIALLGKVLFVSEFFNRIRKITLP